MTNDAGEFLHDLDVNKHTEEEVKTVINAFPVALFYFDENMSLPIHKAVYRIDSAPFIPLLAIEGAKLKVGGEGGRGGLLVKDPNAPINVLQHLVSWNKNLSSARVPPLDILKKLRECGLLQKRDVAKYHLLFVACLPATKDRFDYLVDWAPAALKKSKDAEEYLIHFVLDEGIDRNVFATILNAGLKYYPEHLGFLFQTNDGGKTACEVAFNMHGKEETLNIIQQCIPDNANHPVLHHVIKHAPQYMNDFAMRYPAATFLRDENGRLLLHVALSSGTNLKTDAMFVLRTRDEEIEERDPVNGLYPFMIAASGDRSDLSTIHYLLTRNSSLLYRSEVVSLNNRAKVSTDAVYMVNVLTDSTKEQCSSASGEM